MQKGSESVESPRHQKGWGKLWPMAPAALLAVVGGAAWTLLLLQDTVHTKLFWIGLCSIIAALPTAIIGAIIRYNRRRREILERSARSRAAAISKL